MTEMVCVSANGRITPGCTGMYAPEHELGWRRIVDFVHERTTARIGLQLGHSGRKGSTRLMWEGMDEPLPEGNWEVMGPSPIPYSSANQVPRELSHDEMVRDPRALRPGDRRRGAGGVRPPRVALRTRISALQLHLADFESAYGRVRRQPATTGCAFRSRSLTPCARSWPAHKPMTVRISATDWWPGGTDADDAVEIARAFAAHGADAIDVSTGQVTKDEQPAFGRSYQTPYADRIRNEVGIATIAVGVISSADDVNSLVLAGRADLCALARAHLYDPQWTLHAAADQGYFGPGAEWPDPFKAGSRKPQAGRSDGPKPRLQLIREGRPQTRHSRWRPSAPS